MTRTRTTVRLLSAFLLVGIVPLGCGGDGGNKNVVAPEPCIAFAPASAPAAGLVVTRTVASTCESITLDVVVREVTALFAASFTVEFDPAVVAYTGFSTAGSVLSSDGAQVEMLVQEQSGKVTIGLTRLAVDTGVFVPGEGKLGSLILRKVLDPSTTALSYSDATLLGNETPPVAKPGIEWKGGTLTVQ